MKIVILAGGLGSRLSEETNVLPKPMLEIGGKPIIWHIMKIYSYYGYNDFVICCGYKGYVIKEYFANFFLHQTDVTIDLANNKMEIHHSNSEKWKVTLVDTGIDTMTGGRIKKVQKYVGDERFMLTYGDGVANVNINELVEFHLKQKKSATVTIVQPAGRFGAVEFDNDNFVKSFQEKPQGDNIWINGGFFVLEPNVFDYIKEGDKTIWERTPLENLTKDNELSAFQHNGFWRPMDTQRDKNELQELWIKNQAEWKIWK